MPVMKQLRIGSVNYDTVGEASVTQVQTSGTKIATVTIDGTATDLYAPEGGSSIDPATTAPSMDGTAAAGTSTDYARADHVHPTDTSRAAASHTHAIADVTNLQSALDGKQDALVSGTSIKTVNGESILGSGDLSVGGGGGSGIAYVTVSLTNPKHTGEAENPPCIIYESENGEHVYNPYTKADEYVCGAQIGTIGTPSDSATFVVRRSAYGIVAKFFSASSMLVPTGATCTGDVSYEAPIGHTALIKVDGDGTVTISNVDYDW